jgi:GrpB-like predicted nucleotidyltransferase (UPF0157 family)
MVDEIAERLKAVVIGDAADHGRIVIVGYDAAWPQRFREEATKIRSALGQRVMRLEHIGSTAVPGLPAKPIIDILLVVEDSADEDSYIPGLEHVGYQLRVREPDFEEHRMLRTAEKDVHIHVFSVGSSEIQRHVLFRDHLRQHEADCQRYAAHKRDLARQAWPTMQHYAEAKSEVIAQIMSRARHQSASD